MGGVVSQRGFAFLTLLPYLVGFLAVAGVVGTAYHTVKKSGYTEAQAELQPQIDACQADLTKANEAALAVKAEGDRRIAAAAKGAAQARRQAAGAISEAARLRTLTTPGKAPQNASCESAVAEVRRGLGK